MTNISADDVTETAKGMRAVLDEIEAGNLVCHPATRHRIEGAVLALEQLTGDAGPPRVASIKRAYLRRSGRVGDRQVKTVSKLVSLFNVSTRRGKSAPPTRIPKRRRTRSPPQAASGRSSTTV
jgi:hypothetical protein